MTQAPVVVLGAGCAGLAAAWRLRKAGKDVVLVEADDHVGGLAGGIKIQGNIYEYGPHVFHTTDPEILADVKELMGPDLLPYTRTIRIKFLGKYFDFPLSMKEVLFKLPPTTLLAAGFSFARRFLEGLVRRPAVETSETVLIRYYGDVLYEIFFKDYITRVWGIPPSGFSPTFARERIPRFSVLGWVDALVAGLSKRLKKAGKITSEGYVEKVEGQLYTTRHGFSLITSRMAERFARAGGKLLLNTRATRLNRAGDRIASVSLADGRDLDCAAVVNTLPINEAALAIQPSLGPEAEAAAKHLRFRATVFVGIKASRRQLLPASFMYFREHSFNRITDLSYFEHQVEPPHCTLLVAEVNCDPSDKLWNDEPMAVNAVIDDLVREGILRREEVVETHVFRSRHAYPIYTLGFEKALATLLGAFKELGNLETAGRQGRFQYVNTHVAMKMGYEAADRLLARGAA